MTEPVAQQLSRRERQIMDAIYTLGRATVAEVRERLPEPPSYSAVRALLRILEEKGHLRHESEDNRYVFIPTVPAESARETALRHVLRTFFAGSAAGAMAALLELEDLELSDEEYDRLAAAIEQARREGR
ncbi:MAG: BlaI/MecI/CopY family transcriptional regulator [Acidobacteriota bacterium]|nr:BlaI/MecI/CopY family transcriptional regulator [Acidobacteriota bacterium]MDH3522466.1 BlaI/MecI/CopY family transcriptional regulator [Acidobacteriota bacterium]